VSINATLLIQIIAFVLLIWFVNKMLWGPLSKLMEDRQKKIADGLSAAEKGKHELELAEQKAKDVLKLPPKQKLSKKSVVLEKNFVKKLQQSLYLELKKYFVKKSMQRHTTICLKP
jgi:hypothetical protein